MLGSRPCEVVQCVQGAASLGCADDSESFAQRENLRLTRGVFRPGNTELRSELRDRGVPPRALCCASILARSYLQSSKE